MKITPEELLKQLNEIVKANGYGQIKQITFYRQKSGFVKEITIEIPIKFQA